MGRPFDCDPDRKVSLTFRVWEDTALRINKISKEKGITKTKVVEDAVELLFRYLNH